jgi:hypothetical protein
VATCRSWTRRGPPRRPERPAQARREQATVGERERDGAVIDDLIAADDDFEAS